jgi:transcriptional regulator with XRE-family HTH domain
MAVLSGKLFTSVHFTWRAQGDVVATSTGPRAVPVRSTAAPEGVGSPTVLRILLGARLRRLREAQRISPQEAGYVIRASHSKISRLETGRVGFKDRDIVDLLTLYGVTDEAQRAEMRGLAARANSPGWWHDYSDILAGWFEDYIGLEDAAAEVSTYEAQFVPGLLQTEDYARAVILLQHSNPKGINRRVSLRIARQAILSRPDPTGLCVVLDEAVLSRPMGGSRVMRAQLMHLVEMSQRPRVTIQIMPFTAGGHSAAGGSFSVLHFDDDDLPDVVYHEQLASAQYVDKHEVVEEYRQVLERLRREAASPADSLEMLRAMLRET